MTKEQVKSAAYQARQFEKGAVVTHTSNLRLESNIRGLRPLGQLSVYGHVK